MTVPPARFGATLPASTASGSVTNPLEYAAPAVNTAGGPAADARPALASERPAPPAPQFDGTAPSMAVPDAVTTAKCIAWRGGAPASASRSVPTEIPVAFTYARATHA